MKYLNIVQKKERGKRSNSIQMTEIAFNKSSGRDQESKSLICASILRIRPLSGLKREENLLPFRRCIART